MAATTQTSAIRTMTMNGYEDIVARPLRMNGRQYTPRRHQHRHAQVRPAHDPQDVLFKMADLSFADPETAAPAVAREHPLGTPALREFATRPGQLLHQARAPRVIDHAR